MLVCTRLVLFVDLFTDADTVDDRYTRTHLRCRSRNYYSSSLRCLMDFGPTGEPVACRDLSHLENCGKSLHIMMCMPYPTYRLNLNNESVLMCYLACAERSVNIMSDPSETLHRCLFACPVRSTGGLFV